MDFTIQTYIKLLETLQHQGFVFQTFEAYLQNPASGKTIILRHDVDRIPANALRLAKIEYTLNVKATYFFRIVEHVWDEDIIKAIVGLGHEVAYHYEDLTITKGDFNQAILHFEKHLTNLRRFYPSKTICMHGSPMSKWDNRKLWEKYDYHDFGILGEPYFDVDYSEVFYITDTGRSWNNEDVSIRDVVASGFDIQIKNTRQIITMIQENKMPSKIIINTHPHRWFDPGFNWYKELILQKFKNIIKKYYIWRKK